MMTIVVSGTNWEVRPKKVIVLYTKLEYFDTVS